MLIQSIDKYPSTLVFDNGYIKEIYFADDKVIQIINKVGNTDKNELLDLLNSINNQGLQDIDIEKMRYKTQNKWLGFSCLSSAERIFLIAYLADKSAVKIYLHDDMTSLTKTSLRKFIKAFHNSEYVNIVYSSNISDAYYSEMKRQALG